MRISFRKLTALATLATLFIPAAALAAQAQEEMSVTGTLRHVNPDAQVIIVEDADGNSTKISYTDETEVVGADNTVAGLDSVAGSTVTVTFRVQDAENVATRIEIQPQS